MKTGCVDLFKYTGNLLNAVLPADISIGFTIICNTEQARTFGIKPKVLREVVAVTRKKSTLYIKESHVLSVIQPIYSRILSAIISKFFRLIGEWDRVDHIVSSRRDDSILTRLRANQSIAISSEIATIRPLIWKHQFSLLINISP